MQTNSIPITDLAPIYPRQHVEILKERASKLLPDLDEQGINSLLCALYNVPDTDHLVDHDQILSYPEYQPALSSEELHEMASRIQDKVGDNNPVWVARNILDCVPRSIEDLSDYILDESLQRINLTMLMETDHRKPLEMPEARFYDDEIRKRDMAGIEVSGMIAMQVFQDNDIDEYDCVTPRQRLLSRAGEFYAVHRYGYKTASPWLAKFTHLMDFCTCPNTDCPGRHFGFVDIKGSADIVLESLDFIEDNIRNAANAITLYDDVSIDDIAESDVILVLDVAQSLMVCDPERQYAEQCKALLTFAHKHHALMDTMSSIRLIQVIFLLAELYDERHLADFGMTAEDLRENLIESIRTFQENIGQHKERPPTKELLLHDANNFFANGMEVGKGNFEFGLRLMEEFIKALHSHEDYRGMAGFLKNLLSMGELPKGITNLFYGFLNNIPGVIASRSIATSQFWDDLLIHGPNPKISTILSEQGHPESMEIRRQSASTDWEHRYWSERIRQVGVL